MHHTALVLSFTLAAGPGAAEAAPALLPAAAAEELFAELQAPVAIEDVRVGVADSQLEISFYLQAVGAVSLIIREDDAGAGVGLVKVEDAVVTEVGFVDGVVLSQASDFATLSPEQAVAVVASLVQVWYEDAEIGVLEGDRDFKCWWAGKIAGATIGVAAAAGCGLVAKDPKCMGLGWGVHTTIADYVSDKCNGAQNK
ncbi:hypothetical protein OV079_24185 [Nannocystis pusilla]|uniref:Lipoprotein n=1 Tax=Nannocystis pusilla TaxID=889268 RepID=A0A9X3ESJ3_9BACT|nr:hypothetical protein [Nannocystis pusilla]MCY1008604.1 hypothetical protein [Nannocystis pusilla]